MIKKLIKKVISKFKKETPKKETTKPVVSQKTYYAPVIPKSDHWFGETVKTEKMREYEKQVAAEKQKHVSKEPENIHQKMYERASKYWGTWKEELPGGSENFQEGTNGWNSGTGIRQFQ